ncbi:MAG TPA: basic secretory protein-like protein [Candidatus Angelobacter sp.]|nr:basic secretory protein-like protein [Candidatus Angelobacter sp.]
MTPITTRRLLVAGMFLLLSAPLSNAGVRVSTEHNPGGSGFRFKAVPAPANNDAATKGTFTLVDGERDGNGGEPDVLHDGRVPADEDQPAENFFFRAGTDGGRLQLDLGSVIAVKQVNTYSWHTGTRAPQVYKLFAAEGGTDGFNAAPKRGTDPLSCGWKLVASVDTRPSEDDGGGQYGVTMSDPESGVLGRYRYLLFDISRTEDRDAFGNTFYSEIDVIDANGPAPTAAPAGDEEPIVRSFAAEGGKYKFTLDATAAPDLMEWADAKLRPVVQEWYPKLVAMLPSDGFEAATNVTLRFRNDMGGTPAAAAGGRINLNSGWFRRELKREAVGSVVHEMVHVVQNYGRARRSNPNATRTPGWLVEGIADYIRWFLYEPETKGAEITERNLARTKYDASYRITGNFLNWVTQNHDHEIVRKLNAAAREGKYAEQLWKDWTGKTLQELGDDWKKTNEERISAAQAGSGAKKPDAVVK